MVAQKIIDATTHCPAAPPISARFRFRSSKPGYAIMEYEQDCLAFRADNNRQKRHSRELDEDICVHAHIK